MKKNKKENSKLKEFSVLASVYYKEQPEFCDLALKSILDDQTLLPNEVVLIKDGPLTSELDEVINKYLKKYPKILKVYPLEKNVGLGKALSIGLEKCSYDYVMRMDTDDISVPDRFEKQMKYMIKHPKISVLGGNIIEFDEVPEDAKRIKNMPTKKEDVREYAKFRNPINHMTVCFKKKDILEVGNYQPLHFLEDHYLWSRVLVANKIIENLPETLVYARIGHGFIDRRGDKRYLEGWKILQKYLYDNKFINLYQKIRNLLGMYIMIHISPKTRNFLYNKVLRKNKEK